MRLFIIFILGMVFFSASSVAQDDNVTTATSALQNVLSALQQSAEKLRLDNEQLTAHDNTMKQQLSQLQARLERLEAQGDLLNKTVARLQDNNPRRARQITRLEQENFDLDNRIQKDQDGIKLTRRSMASGYEEDQKLLLQLKAMTNALPAHPQALSPEAQAEARRQKEKLKLMKMIYESQQRQESLHEAILEIQKNTPLLPAAGALAHQQLLKEQIRELEGQMAGYPPEKASANFGYADEWGGTQLRQLELELKFLERNYLQLKDLMEQMDKKARNARLTLSEHVEEAKLQGSVDDLNRQGVGLRVDLDDLRSQMVDLDKRKSRLEEMIKQLP